MRTQFAWQTRYGLNYPPAPQLSYLTVVLISKRCMCFFAFIPSFRPTDVGCGLEESSFCLSPIFPRSALGPLCSMAHGDLQSQ